MKDNIQNIVKRFFEKFPIVGSIKYKFKPLSDTHFIQVPDDLINTSEFVEFDSVVYDLLKGKEDICFIDSESPIFFEDFETINNPSDVTLDVEGLLSKMDLSTSIFFSSFEDQVTNSYFDIEINTLLLFGESDFDSSDKWTIAA